MIKTIDVVTLKSWIEKEEAIVLDVREPAEYAAQNISGAHSVPLSRFSKKDIPPAGGKKIVLYCLAGRRSQTAALKLSAEDSSMDIYSLEGGISAWTQAGYAVCASGKYVLPLDRQVQLVVGLGVLAGSLLTFWVSSRFVWVTAFLGAGLTFAGVSGFCGLAVLMAKLPWNQKGSCEKTSEKTSCSLTKA